MQVHFETDQYTATNNSRTDRQTDTLHSESTPQLLNNAVHNVHSHADTLITLR